ncbi:lysine--tRNA ligase [Pseudomonadota bacterium]
MSEIQDNDQVLQRRAKLAGLREEGNPYPNDFRPADLAADLHERFEDLEAEALEAQDNKVVVAGRMMSRRIMGKASFCHIQDRSGRIQLFVQRDELPEGVYNTGFKKWDIGDIVGAEGVLFRTKTGELTVRVSSVRLVTKSLRPLPEKYHGLSDTELRYRQRYVDLIMNPDTRRAFETRAAVVSSLRQFLKDRDFLEVETPMMQVTPGGAVARPFVTHHNALDMELYLRIAPELYLKRLVVGGIERVFEINRNFRNEGVSTQHNPEFTMLEFYQAYADFEDFMDLTEGMLREACTSVLGRTGFEYQGESFDFGKPFERLSLKDSVLKFNPDLSANDIDDPERLTDYAGKLGIKADKNVGIGIIQTEIFEHTVEGNLRQPTFITHYPVEVSPLSRMNDRDPAVTDRFELIIAGREIANGFSELNDPEDQAERFRHQVSQREGGDDEAMYYDADYIRALEYGMPPAAGEGVGVDRLVMLLTDSASIRDVLLFPHMRPESG